MKPMLAVQAEDITKLKYPVMVSPKLDGVRALVIDGVLMSRSLKPIPNRYAQKLFAGLPDGTDGELILGEPTQDPYRKTVSAVMSEDGEPEDLRFYIFDNFNLRKLGFKSRFECVSTYKGKNVVVVPHYFAPTAEALEVDEAEFLAQGYEGAMVRSIDGPYKFGRSTEREGYLLKLKRFKDAEAIVIGFYEFMHNDNEAKTNELGRTERSSHKENLRPAGILGGLEVIGTNGEFKGVQFRIGGGWTMADRAKLWKDRTGMVNQLAKFKYFPMGGKDKPRFPVFIGWRDERDM